MKNLILITLTMISVSAFANTNRTIKCTADAEGNVFSGQLKTETQEDKAAFGDAFFSVQKAGKAAEMLTLELSGTEQSEKAGTLAPQEIAFLDLDNYQDSKIAANFKLNLGLKGKNAAVLYKGVKYISTCEESFQ